MIFGPKTKYNNLFEAILTDPPYGKEYLNLYEQLAGHAPRILKENGSLLVMTRESYLPEIYEIFSIW
jgi:tRNA G10  N-methylase Trm11